MNSLNQMIARIIIISLILIGCYECQENYIHREKDYLCACLRKDDCKLPMHQRVETPNRAECQQSFSMYSFNPETRNCEDKTAKGCPSNLNSFNNYYTCITYCLRPNFQKESCERLNLTTRCNNFEHRYFKYYFDGKTCEQQFTGNCQFNGNHFHNKHHCESTCGDFMDSTRKGHIVNLNLKRKSWCFERFSFTVDDKCISRTDDSQVLSPEKKTKYRFNYLDNSCKMFETDQCTFNGNVFNTIEECVSDCLPKTFDCLNCDIGKFNRYKAKCRANQGVNTHRCSISNNRFNWTVLAQEVERIRSDSLARMMIRSTNTINLFFILIILFNLKNLFSKI